MSMLDRRIVELQARIAAKELELKTHRARIINAVGHLGTARQLRDADLDDLVTDVSSLCALKAEVAALLQPMAELGSA